MLIILVFLNCCLCVVPLVPIACWCFCNHLSFFCVCNNELSLLSCFFSAKFASLSATDSEADGDGKKRATTISRLSVDVLLCLFPHLVVVGFFFCFVFILVSLQRKKVLMALVSVFLWLVIMSITSVWTGITAREMGTVKFLNKCKPYLAHLW